MTLYNLVCLTIFNILLFCRTFGFQDQRVDEALRSFLETFRLPGESPVIEHIMESFSENVFVS